MSKQSIAIINANVVNEGSINQRDILIDSGRIKRIDNQIRIDSNTEVIDAKGQYLMPGLIDDQVHFREPGLTHKGGIRSESAAAVAGGVTSFMDMPNVNPPTVTRDLLSQKYLLAEGKAHANYAFYLGATNNNIEEIKNLKKGEACGVKVFMGASTGNMLVDNDNALERIFSDSPVLIATHCEDTPLINKNLEFMREQYGNLPIPVSEHPNIRSVEACYKSSSKAVALAKKFGSKLHVLHLTSAKELSLFENKDHREKHITAEVCVHHLYFNDSDYDEFQQFIVCNPAIKTQSDQTALMESLNNNGLDVIATDHAPHTFEEKKKAYPDCPSGLPLVQHSLLLLLEFFHQGLLTLETIAAKTSHNVAEIYGIKDRGFVREDYWADLVLVNLESKTHVSSESILYECSWSPFVDKTFNSMINKTFVNGQLVYDAGNILTEPSGIRLDFE